MCKIFSGWELVNSYNEILKLGSGSYMMDIINDKVYFNKSETNKVRILYAVEHFVKDEIYRMGLTLKDFDKIYFGFEANVVSENDRCKNSNEIYYSKSGKRIRGRRCNHIEFTCFALIRSEEDVYESSYEFEIKWPHGWLES